MEPHSVERRLAAILSADVVGYSRLMAEDEAATIHTLTEYREEIAMRVRHHRGRVVDAPGDNLLAEFPTALDAVRCAVEAQGVLRSLNASLSSERRMDFRIGVHMGDVAAEGERIYGDGVNIAARLEALAEAGGVCISATVHEQVRNKLDVGFTDLGDQTVKNIPDRVRVYRVQPRGRPEPPASAPTSPEGRLRRLRRALVATAAAPLILGLGLWASWPRPLGLLIDLAGVSGPPVEPALPDEPSIVVLPFTNMSGDAGQEYFSDGITEDLTTDLSGVPDLFVIARNSAFAYKGRNVPLEVVGRELGVRYVLEGSVRKMEDRVRVTAQLIDATSGFHLWSHRYDRSLADVFALQSEISEAILGALRVEIREAELERIRRKPTRDLSAYDAYLRAVFRFELSTREDMAEARRLAERAIELDPSYAEAHALLSGTFVMPFLSGWNRDPSGLERGAELARRAIELDRFSAAAHLGLAWIDLARGRLAESLAGAERAVELAPNWDAPHFMRAVILTYQGGFLAASQAMNRAMRLNPRPPSHYLVGVGWVNLRAGREREALRIWERARAENPDLVFARVALASLHEKRGRHAEARAVVEEILRVNPDLTAKQAAGMGFERFDPEYFAEFEERLRSAGLPDASAPKDPFTVPGFGGAPAIAVLPFDNLGGDPEQEYFADGMAEDLITRISAWRRLPVIARNSSFVYKGRPVDVKQVSRDLGVRYVVEGSVRRGGDRVRISAQLIDATTGHHVWAETYDRELRDVFAVQDEISLAIASAMRPELARAEVERAVRKRPRSLDAYESQLRGMWHFRKGTREHNAEARRFLERAVELDPRHADFRASLALVHYADIVFEWSDSRSRSIAALERAAGECVALDPESARCQVSLGYSLSVAGRQHDMIAAFESATRLDPSLGIAHGWLGMALALAGRPEEAIASLEKALRLSPHDLSTGLFLVSMGWAHFAAGRYGEALRWADRALEHHPREELAYRSLAASYAQLGRLPEARKALEEALRLDPELSLRKVRQQNSTTDPDYLARWIDGLRKAGLKE